MGHGFKGGTGRYHSIGENLHNVCKSYTYNDATGYFGVKGLSSRSSIRNIASNTPIATAKDFYDKLSCGGIEKKMENGNGVITTMKDGTIITFRRISSSDGTPAVDINISTIYDDTGGVKTQKIHFIIMKGAHER